MIVRLTARLVIIVLLVLALLDDSADPPLVFAEPPRQRPTEEPTKPPYVFPTPIFIPTYSGEPPPSGTAVPGTPAVATRAATQPAKERTYTVVAGDSPWTISTKVYGVGTRSDIIMKANGITDPTRLKVGMVLKIPAADAGGQPLPTVAPTAVRTQPPPSPSPQPTTAPTVTPTPVPSPTPRLAGNAYQIALLLVDVFSGMLFLASMAAGLLSFLLYRRSQYFYEMDMRAKRIRLR